MGNKFLAVDFCHIDLSASNNAISHIKSQDQLTHFLEEFKKENSCILPYGGYGEKRNFYGSGLFQSDSIIRDIHLAIDVWSLANTPIYAPLAGSVFSMAYNNNGLDYGYTLILKHQFDETKFYSLYGHLSSSIYDFWKIGQGVKSGELMAHFGEMNENGGWSPHVHFQLILDIQNNKGDYPGVCSETEKGFYLSNCPDPTFLVLPKK
jgi:murein DD-endopeptidase MepM/ murein hydrolase activator NlpD